MPRDGPSACGPCSSQAFSGLCILHLRGCWSVPGGGGQDWKPCACLVWLVSSSGELGVSASRLCWSQSKCVESPTSPPAVGGVGSRVGQGTGKLGHLGQELSQSHQRMYICSQRCWPVFKPTAEMEPEQRCPSSSPVTSSVSRRP